MTETSEKENSPLIGPHTNRELELMLAGKKKLSYFSDLAPEDGNISEEIIPEQAFAPYVSSGQIIRRSVERAYTTGGTLRQVCFALPGEEWRIDAILFLRQDTLKNPNFYWEMQHADDVIVGRLLGYSKDEIRAFIKHKNRPR